MKINYEIEGKKLEKERVVKNGGKPGFPKKIL
jgi:hypothetical protein